MIPRRIHQIWIGPRPLPKATESWRDRHPDWEYFLWTEETIPFPLGNQHQYEASSTYSGKSNVIRYEVMHRYGGVYVDADTGCLRPLDEELLETDFFCVYEDERALPGRIGTTYFGCTAKHPIMKAMMDSIASEPAETVARNPSWKITGPLRFTQIVDRFPDVRKYPSWLFFPFHHSGNQCSEEELDRAHAVHLWDTTYHEMGGYPAALTDYADVFGFQPAAPPEQAQGESRRPVLDRVYTATRGARLTIEGDNYAITRAEGRIPINPPAAAIFGLCDGTRTVAQVVSELSQLFPSHARNVRWDAPLTVLRLQRRGALRTVQ